MPNPRTTRRPFVVVVVVLIGCFCPSAVSAQQVQHTVSDYVMKRWTTADGLPHNWISAILQTSDGSLWLGMNNAGLVRFDGVTFTTFNMLNTPALPSDQVTRLQEDRDGILWIATPAGLVRYHAGVFTAERLDDVLSYKLVIDMRADRDGRLWVAAEREVIRRDGDTWTVVLREAGVRRLWASSDGTMWIATYTTLLKWRDRVVRTVAIQERVPGEDVFALLEDRTGRLWIGTARGLAHLDTHNDGAELERTMLAKTTVSALFEDSNGTMWFGGRNRVYAQAPDGTLSESTLESGDGIVEVVSEDREGHIWVGARGWQGGLYRLTRQRVSMMESGMFPCDNTGAVTQGVDGTMWVAMFCADGTGVFGVRGAEVTAYTGPRFVSSLLAEPDGTLWAGTFSGLLFRLRGGRFEEIEAPTLAPDDATNAINTIYRDPGGSLWLGTSTRGLFRWRDEQWTRFQTNDGLASNDVRSLIGDRDGAMWIGMDGGVSRYHNGQFTTYRVADGVPPGPVRTMHLDADGVLWVGAYGGGLARFKGGAWTRYGVRGGVLDSSVHRILEDDNGFLWLTGDRGIRRVSKQDLNAVAEAGAESIEVTLLTDADGMRSLECNGMAQPAGWRMQDGAFYFPTQGGVARVDPARVARDAPMPPQPHIEDASVDGASVPWASTSEVVIAPGYRDVELRYTAPAFARPELVQFRYRLEGYSNDWTDVGTRRVASFVNLPPGRYRFLVSAGSGNTWSERPAALALVLQPFLYQRRWFQVALGVLALVAAGGLGQWYVARLRQLASALERAVTERTADLSTAHQHLSAANEGLVKANHAVEQAHGQVLAVLNQLDIGVLILTPGGMVRYASAAAQRVLGKDEQALVGRPWPACLPLVDADRAQVQARVETLSPSGGRVPAQMVIGGTRYWMEIDIRDEPPPGDGRILYLYSVTEMSLLSTDGRADGPHGLIGRSTVMHLLFKQIRDVGRVDTTVLIEGETGVGKELVARAIHRESRRAERPFVAVNAAGLSESLIASQLFGHRRGSFTGAIADQVGVFEAANGGTLFLDEIGDMPLNVQASLLRVLQEREITRLGDSQARAVDVRFLAATHRDLTKEVFEGRFREDLLYRIRVATIKVPPLRDHASDVPLLADAFLTRAAQRAGRPVPQMSRDAIDALMRYTWPGNVRELQAAMEQALVRADGDIVRADDVLPGIAPDPPSVAMNAANRGERKRIVEALRRAGGNRKEAARLLGMARSTLYLKLAEYGLDADGT